LVQVLSNDQIIYSNEDLIAIAKGQILKECAKYFGENFLADPDKCERVKRVLVSLQAQGCFKEPHKTACDLILKELEKDGS
jgi:hypothetical protein